ncbi:MAG: phosphoadenosine phosphosulfate reductase family protein [Archaeoglobaceae archaeon]
MLRIATRSRKDAKAIRHAVEAYYKGWDFEVISLGGVRSKEEILERLRELEDVVVLANREDAELFEGYEFVHVVRKRKIRNMRLEEIREEIELARAKMRLAVSYDRTYILGSLRNPIVNAKPHHDVFLLKSPGTVLGEGHYVALRDLGGLHYIFSKGRVAGRIHIKDYGCDVRYEGEEPESVDVAELAKANEDFLLKAERKAVSWLRGFETKEVVVPWSGGKDSTTALFLAMKAFGDVKAVFIDVDVDFEENREFVKRVAEEFGIDLYTYKLKLSDKISELGLPSHERRWCTGLKLKLFEEIYEEFGECLVVVGDRDVESESRSSRPPVYRAGKVTVVAPLRSWNTMHLQLYVKLRELPLNPLYELGFYRIGCYICPSLRSWELSLMLNLPNFKRLKGNELFKLFLRSKLAEDL